MNDRPETYNEMEKLRIQRSRHFDWLNKEGTYAGLVDAIRSGTKRHDFTSWLVSVGSGRQEGLLCPVFVYVNVVIKSVTIYGISV